VKWLKITAYSLNFLSRAGKRVLNKRWRRVVSAGEEGESNHLPIGNDLRRAKREAEFRRGDRGERRNKRDTRTAKHHFNSTAAGGMKEDGG